MPTRELENFELKDIPLAKLKMDPDAERLEKQWGFIGGGRLTGEANLTDSLRSDGQLNPIIGYPDGDACCSTDGFHRIQAAQRAGLETLKCRVYPTKKAAMRAAMIDSYRRPRKGSDVMRLCGYLQEETGLSQRRIADMLGVSSCRISQAKRMRREVEGNPRWEALRKDNVSAEVAYELLNYTPNEVPKLMKDFKQSSDPQKTRRSQGPPLHFLRRLRAVTTLREAYFGGQVTLPQVQMLLSAFPVTRTSEISALASWVARAKPSQETLTGLLEQVQRGMPLELLIPGESPSLSAPEPISMLLGTLAQNHSGSIRGARVALRLADSEAERSELIVVLTCKGRPEADAIIGLAKTAEALQQPDRERSGQT